MPNTANKVHFGLKNVHYAVITYGATGAPTFATPVAVPGAVSLTLSKEGSDTDFYADDVKYYHLAGNNGYSGSLEMASFPVQMRQDLWGMTVTETGKFLVESASAQPAEFALMFEIDGDQAPDRYCIFRCVASRPDVASTTKAESTDVQTQSCDLTAMPVLDPTDDSPINGMVFYKTTADTPSASYEGFFNAVSTTLA